MAKHAIITGITGQDGADDYAVDIKTGDTIIKINPEFYRPAEVELLIGNPSKAKIDLGWSPYTILEELCSMMVNAALKRVEQGVSF